MFVRQHSSGQQQPAVAIKSKVASAFADTPEGSPDVVTADLDESDQGSTSAAVVEAPAEAAPLLHQELQHKATLVNADSTEDGAELITVGHPDEAEQENTTAAVVEAPSEAAPLLKQELQHKFASVNADMTEDCAELITVGHPDEAEQESTASGFVEAAHIIKQDPQSKVASANADVIEDRAELIAVGHPEQEVDDSMTAASAALIVPSSLAQQPLQNCQSIAPKTLSQDVEHEEGEAVSSSVTHSSEIMGTKEEVPLPHPACNDQSSETMENQAQLIAQSALPVEVSSSLMLLSWCLYAVQACAGHMEAVVCNGGNWQCCLWPL